MEQVMKLQFCSHHLAVSASQPTALSMFSPPQAKLRCLVLEDELVNLVITAMEKSESEDATEDGSSSNQLLWQHLSSQLIYFVLFQFASFPYMVTAMYEKVSFQTCILQSPLSYCFAVHTCHLSSSWKVATWRKAVTTWCGSYSSSSLAALTKAL